MRHVAKTNQILRIDGEALLDEPVFQGLRTNCKNAQPIKDESGTKDSVYTVDKWV